MTGEQADHLAQVTKERGVKSMVCFSYRFKASARYAKDLIERGLIGDIYHVDMQYYQAWGLPMCNTPLVWRFEQKHTGSGALGDLGSHALDLVRFVTGKEYKRLISHTGTFVHEREKLDSSGMGKVDVDAEGELAMRYGVMNIPTVIFFKDGKEIAREVGALPPESFTRILDENL